jgi:hypothetical protein
MSVRSPAAAFNNELFAANAAEVRMFPSLVNCCTIDWWRSQDMALPHAFHMLFDSIYLILSMLGGGLEHFFIFPYGKNHPN